MLSHRTAIGVVLMAAAMVAVPPLQAHDTGCEEDYLEPCSTEDARGEVFEAETAFLLAKGTGRILFRHAPNDKPVRGVLLRVAGFDYRDNPKCAGGLDDTSDPEYEDDASNNVLEEELGPLQRHRPQWNDGFHVYLLDWCDKSADIRRNSLVFEEALERIHAGDVSQTPHPLEADQELVVVGASMGGVVARHALARMEQEGADHDVDLFVSFDAPQEGAYLPIGVQLANQFVINTTTGLASALSAVTTGVPFVPVVYLAALAGNEQAQMLRGMNTQAAEQLLLVHHSTLGNGRPAVSRQIFAAELANLGYPSDGIRNVAIASGSGFEALEYRPLVENEEGDKVRGPVVPRPVRGFRWQSKTLTIEREYDLEVRLPVSDTLLWSSTLRARLKFNAEMDISPLTAGAGQEVFRFTLAGRPELRLNGLRLADAELPSASALAQELGLDGEVADRAGDVVDALLASTLDRLEDFVDDNIDALTQAGLISTSSAEYGYEAAPGGLGGKYVAFSEAFQEGFQGRSLGGTFSGGWAPEVFIPTASALGVERDPSGPVTELDIEASPFDQLYHHRYDSGHTEPTPEVAGWLCRETKDLLGETYITGMSPTTRPVQGTAFTLTVKGSNFNESSGVVWDVDSATPTGRTLLETTFVSRQELQAVVPAALTMDLTPCLPDSFCGNPRFPGLHEPVEIRVSTPEPTTPAAPPLREPSEYACVQSRNFQIQEVPVPELTPAEPTALDDITVRYSDDWTTGCVPEQPMVEVTGTMIDVTTTGDPGICTFEYAPYELEFQVGPLPAGEYRLDIVDERGDRTTEISTSGFTVRNPQPEIQVLNPYFIPAHSPETMLDVLGSGFIEGDSVVYWDGEMLETTFQSSGLLTALVPAGNVAEEGFASITVVTQDPVEPRTSNAVELLIGLPELTLDSIDPEEVPAGSPDTTIELRGDGFTFDSEVLWTGPNGARFSLESTVQDGNTIHAVFPAAEQLYAGAHALSVRRGEEETDPLTFRVVGEGAGGAAVAQAVVNAANFEEGVAPGSIATVFGLNLSSSTVEASSFPIPTELGGASLTIGGVAARILYASENQVNFQVPFEVELGTAAVVAGSNGATGPTGGAEVKANAFGAFQYARVADELDLIVIHQDGSLVTPDSPAMPGEVVTLFGTGIGELTVRPATGEAAAADPLSECVSYPQALVTAKDGGELEAAVLFCGLTPGFAGLAQLNLQMPDVPLGGPNPTLYLSFDGETLLSRPFDMD